jgi:phage/plasmid-like protein (TIGR03299 family)
MPAFFECGFSVREPMWHGQGMVASDYPESWDQAREWAGLQWEPTKVPVYTERLVTIDQFHQLGRDGVEAYPLDVPAAGDAADRLYKVMVPAEDHRAIIRDDTRDVLAVPTKSYELITHAQMGDIMDAVLEADGNVRFETAGSVRDGRQVWALAYLDEPYEVPGDDSQTFPFLALLNAHDGSAACKLTYTDVRVVCWNTWNAASEKGERSGAQFVFRHTGNVAERIDEAKTALSQLRKDSKATQALFEHLARVPVNDDQVKTFTQLFIASPADRGEFVSERVAANVDHARATFTRLHNEAVTTEAIRGTAYGLTMAATEYLDHVRRHRTHDSLMNRTLLRPEGAKSRALDLIEDIVGADWKVREAREASGATRRRAKLAIAS